MATLLERSEPIPPTLQLWCIEVAIGKRRPPGQRRGPKEQSNRDVRIVAAFHALRKEGATYDKAFEIIGDVICRSPEAVRSVIRRVKKDRPFRS